MASIPNLAFDLKSPTNSVLVSPAAQTAADLSFSLGPQLTWDSYWRSVYQKANAGLQDQANTLMTRGNVTAEEARLLVESQRNELVMQLRNRLSPFGRRYSEILKPASKLPTLETLVEQKGSIEAVLQSVGKTRVVVNRIAFVSRVAGPALIALSVVMTVYIVWSAPPEERARIAAREGGSLAGGLGGGSLGAWAGCGIAASFTSPSLVVPIWGEVTEGAACLVGGIAGGLGIGFAGSKVGAVAGEKLYDFVTTTTWNS